MPMNMPQPQGQPTQIGPGFNNLQPGGMGSGGPIPAPTGSGMPGPGGPPPGMAGPPGMPPQGMMGPEAPMDALPQGGLPPGEAEADPAAEFDSAMEELVNMALQTLDEQERKMLKKIMAPDASWILAKIFGGGAVGALKAAVAQDGAAAQASTGPQSLMR